MFMEIWFDYCLSHTFDLFLDILEINNFLFPFFKKIILTDLKNWLRITWRSNKMLEFCWWIIKISTFILYPQILDSFTNSIIDLLFSQIFRHLIDILVHWAIFRHLNECITKRILLIFIETRLNWFWFPLFYCVSDWIIENGIWLSTSFWISCLLKMKFYLLILLQNLFNILSSLKINLWFDILYPLWS